MTEDIGGISVAIKADTSQFIAAVDKAQAHADTLQNVSVEITASVDTKDIENASKSLKEAAQKAAEKMGPVEVTLKAIKVIKPAAEVILPVTFKWNGKWSGTPPSPTVSVQGGGGGGETGGGTSGGTTGPSESQGGGGTTKRPPRRPSGGAAAAESQEPAEAKTASTGYVRDKIRSAAKGPSAATTPAPKTCAQCGAQYTGTWNDHQKSQDHRMFLARQKTKEQFAGTKEAARPPEAGEPPAEPFRIDLDQNNRLQRLQQARVLGERGIYPQGTAEEVAQFRRELIEQREIGGKRNVTARYPDSGIVAEYRRLGGNMEALLGGSVNALGPRPGLSKAWQTRFFKQFPSLRPGLPIAEEEPGEGIDPRSAAAAGYGIKTKFTKPERRLRAKARSLGRIGALEEASDFAGILSTDPRIRRYSELTQKPPSQEFFQLSQYIARSQESSPEGLIDRGTRLNLPEDIPGAKQIGLLQQVLAEALSSGDVNQMKEVFDGARQLLQRISGELNEKGKRSAERKGERKLAAGETLPEDYALRGGARGSRRVRRQTARGSGRVARHINAGVDLAILDANAAAGVGARQFRVAGEQETSSSIAEAAQDTRRANQEAIEAGRLVPKRPEAQSRFDTPLKRVQEEIRLTKERIATLQDSIKHGKKIKRDVSRDQDALKALKEHEKLLLDKGILAIVSEKPVQEIDLEAGPSEKRIDSQAGRRAKTKTDRVLKQAASLEKKYAKAIEKVQAITPATVSETFSDEAIAARAAERARAREEARFGKGEPPVRQFTGNVTGGEGVPLDKILEENATLKARMAEDQAARQKQSEFLSSKAKGQARAASGRFVKPGSTVSSGGGGPVHVWVDNWPSSLGGSGGSVAAGEPVRLKGFKGKGGKKSEAADIEDELNETDAERERLEKLFGKKRLSRTKIREAIGFESVSQIAASVEDASAAMLDEGAKLKRSAHAVLEENPVRALSVAVGQIAVNLIGGREKLKTDIEKVDRASSTYNKAVKRQSDVEARLRETRLALRKFQTHGATEEAEQAKKQRDELTGQLGRAKQVTQRSRRILEERTEEVTARRPRQIAATLAVGTVGIVGGTLLFQGAMAAANVALEAFSKGLERGTDRETNFEQKTGELVSSLADATRANHGNVDATVTSQVALSGLGDAASSLIKPFLETRASVTAGAKALEEQALLFNAAKNIRGGQALGGIDIAGLTKTTGGFPIFNIGGQRSPLEIFGNEIEANAPFQAAKVDVFGHTATKGDIGRGIQQVQPSTAFSPERLGDLNQYLGTLNENAQKLGATTQLVANQTGELSDAQRQALESAVAEAKSYAPDSAGELDAFLSKLEKAGVYLADFGGKAQSSGAELIRFVDQLSRGAFLQSPRQLITAQGQQISAQLQSIAAQGGFERGTTIPAQQFIQQLTQGRVSAGGLQRPGFGLTEKLPEDFASQAENFDQIKGEIDAVNSKLTETASSGRDAAVELLHFADINITKSTGQVSNLAGTFTNLTESIASAGQRIHDLQLTNIWQQVNLQTAQYDESLRVANLSLNDAKEFLTGIRQANSDGLGILQHQTRELEKQSTLIGFQSQQLGFELAQRQINFRVASAGFTAPGTTPEERAARIQEAKVEADYAQKQLDFQKQQFTIAQKLFDLQQGGGGAIDIQAARAIEATSNQIELLTRARQVTINVAVNEEAIAAYQDQLQQDVAQVQSILGEATSVQQEMLQLEAQTVSLLGGFMRDYADTIVGGLNDYFRRVRDTIPTTRPSIGSTKSNPGTYAPTAHAAGYLGNISGATSMIVGEAGNETVAILRNPREMSMGIGGGGSTQINITVTGNSIAANDENDLSGWADKLTRMIEERLGRRASLQGLRGI